MKTLPRSFSPLLFLGGLGALPAMLMADASPVPTPSVSLPTAPVIHGGDTAFVLISAALVLLMTPGLALFYGGMVRKKNVLGTMMQSFVVMALVSVQ